MHSVMWINLVTLTITITTTSIWIILVLDDCSPLFNKLNCYDIILQHRILMTLYCNIHLLWHYIAILNCDDIILQDWIVMTLYCNIEYWWHYIATFTCYDIILQYCIVMTLYCNIEFWWHYIATFTCYGIILQHRVKLQNSFSNVKEEHDWIHLIPAFFWRHGDLLEKIHI